MKLSLKLEHTDQPDVYRAFIFKTFKQGYRPVTVIEDIAEGDLAALLNWFTEFYRHVTLVRTADGVDEEPDCLTTWEAAEAAVI